MPITQSARGFWDKVVAMSSGIAQAEGFFAGDTLPARRNNPGSIRLGGETSDITQFDTVEEGWDALHEQVGRILTGNSRYYNVDMTFERVADIYTGRDNPEGWALTVSQAVGMQPYNTIRQFVES